MKYHHESIEDLLYDLRDYFSINCECPKYHGLKCPSCDMRARINKFLPIDYEELWECVDPGFKLRNDNL